MMVLYSPDWTNTGFSFILLTVNLFRHSTLTEQGLYVYCFTSLSHDTAQTSSAAGHLLLPRYCPASQE